ncbi:hypothetical protein V6N13_133829 [Hibiscus sabdariffa]
MLQQITHGRAVLPGYMEWFYENGKPFIMTREARVRVLRVPRPERPRQQRGPRPTSAFHPDATSNRRVFSGAFQPYSSMMVAHSHSPGHFYPPPLSMYPPQDHTFGSSYGMVHQTPPCSLFATGPSGSGHHADDNADESEEDDDDTEPLVRRNPPRHRRAPDCGMGGHRRH